jgi:hypothetical protein
MSVKQRNLSRILSSACLALLANSASAVVVVGGDNGWEVSFDGSVNGFLVHESQDIKPSNTVGGNISNNQDSTRVRTGLLPAVFGFNVKSPLVDGLRGSARIGFYPQIQNADQAKNAFGSQIDLREAFFKVEGNFGEALVGRALSLYQGKNLLTDMTLFGVGVQGGVNGGGTTLGRIGYGYVYNNFNPSVRYTTPSFKGLQLSAGIYDPSVISGSGVSAKRTKTPRIESELSYATKLGNDKVQLWLSAMSQKADFDQSTTAGAPKGSVKATGWAYGAQYVMSSGLELLASGYTGKGLGSTLMLDSDSLDSMGKERDNKGFLLQAAYTYQKTKVGLSYGQSRANETSADLDLRMANGSRQIAKQSSTTLGVYHDVNKWLKLVAEYTRATNEWHGPGSKQEADVISVGGFFMW